MTAPGKVKKQSVWKVLLFWCYVLVPLGWGVSATVKKAMTLFN
jgi:hypothetical protein